MKVFIQIPCFNERDQLEATLADLPRTLPDVDEIHVLVIDDGSTDGTADVAEELGVHHIVRFPRNRGLAAAFSAGIDACLRLGADVIVNTDADNQYRGEDIARLVEPVVRGDADITIGDRRTDAVAEFSFIKRWLQRWGSRVVRRASGTAVADATSGFRAMTRKAAYTLFVHNRFTYTLETIIQAGRVGLLTKNVEIRTNPAARESRLFRGIVDYLRRGGPVIGRAYAMYRPVQTFAYVALLLFLAGSVLIGRFLYYYFTGAGQGHVQSVVVGVGAVVLAFLVGIMALLSELLAANRRILEETLARVRRLDSKLAELSRDSGGVEGVHTTGAVPWGGSPESGPIESARPKGDAASS